MNITRNDESYGRVMPAQKPHRSNQVVGTPWPFIRAVENLIGEPFAIDLAATHKNAKAPLYFTAEDDFFKQEYTSRIDNSGVPVGYVNVPDDAWAWLNPEYTDIDPYAKKCKEDSKKGAKIAFLVPASTGSNWYADHVHGHALILFVSPRLAFEGHHNRGCKDPECPGCQSYPKDLILALYGEPPGFEVWRWKNARPQA